MILAFELRWRHISHRLPVAACIRRSVSGLLQEGVVVEVFQGFHCHLGGAKTRLRVCERFHVVGLFVLPKLCRLVQGLVKLCNLFPEDFNLCLELPQLRLDVVDFCSKLLDVGGRGVTIRNCGSHLLIAEGFRLSFRFGLLLEFRDEVLDHATDLDEVVLLGSSSHRQSGQLRASQAKCSVLDEDHRALERDSRALGRGALLQKGECPDDLLSCHLKLLRVDLWGLLELNELLICIIVRLSTRLELLNRCSYGCELSRARLGSLVEQLGLSLASLGELVKESFVSLQVFLFFLQFGLSVSQFVLFLTQKFL